MADNTWQIAQMMMWAVGIQTLVISAILGVTWNSLNKRLDRISDKIDKLDDRIQQIDKRMVAVETILMHKECCMLRDDRQVKKAE